MKNFCALILIGLCYSFCPSGEREVNNSRNGFYIHVMDLTDRSYHSYILDSSDSVNSIFNAYFDSELELSILDRPISIYNGKYDFYVARVTVFEKSNGDKGFKHLKYPKVYIKQSKLNKRSRVKEVLF